MKFAFNKEDVFSVLDAESVESYIQKEGYFGDSLSELNMRIEKEESHILIKCDRDDAYLAFTYDDGFEEISRALFIPAEKVIKI